MGLPKSISKLKKKLAYSVRPLGAMAGAWIPFSPQAGVALCRIFPPSWPRFRSSWPQIVPGWPTRGWDTGRWPPMGSNWADRNSKGKTHPPSSGPGCNIWSPRSARKAPATKTRNFETVCQSCVWKGFVKWIYEKIPRKWSVLVVKSKTWILTNI